MAKQPVKKGNSGLMVILIIGSIIGIAFIKPGLSILAGIGLAPTLASWLLETSTFRAIRLRAFFFFNMAGLFPFVGSVLASSSFQESYRIVANVQTIGMMWGPLIGAYVALWLGPYASAFVSQVLAADKVRRVVKNQTKLVNEWGPEIVGPHKEFFIETGYKYEAPKREKQQAPQPQKSQKQTSTEI